MNARAQGQDSVDFPIPSQPLTGPVEAASHRGSILNVPPEIIGGRRYTDRNRTSSGMVSDLERFGISIPDIDGLVAHELSKLSTQPKNATGRGARRYRDTFYSRADAEQSVGKAVSRVMSTEIFDERKIGILAQVLLGNDDPWIFNARPTPIGSRLQGWEPISTSLTNEINLEETRSAMCEAVSEIAVPGGWSALAGIVIDRAWPFECELYYWLETENDRTFVLGTSKLPTCASGRAFVWQFGTVFQAPNMPFAMAYISGGRNRLPHCSFAVQPAKFLRDNFGWQQSLIDARTWLRNDTVVAKYETRTRPDSLGSNGHQQPIIMRWLISNEERDRLTAEIGQLKPRSHFQHAKSGE